MADELERIVERPERDSQEHSSGSNAAGAAVAAVGGDSTGGGGGGGGTEKGQRSSATSLKHIKSSISNWLQGASSAGSSAAAATAAPSIPAASAVSVAGPAALAAVASMRAGGVTTGGLAADGSSPNSPASSSAGASVVVMHRPLTLRSASSRPPPPKRLSTGGLEGALSAGPPAGAAGVSAWVPAGVRPIIWEDGVSVCSSLLSYLTFTCTVHPAHHQASSCRESIHALAGSGAPTLPPSRGPGSGGVLPTSPLARKNRRPAPHFGAGVLLSAGRYSPRGPRHGPHGHRQRQGQPPRQPDACARERRAGAARQQRQRQWHGAAGPAGVVVARGVCGWGGGRVAGVCDVAAQAAEEAFVHGGLTVLRKL